LFAARDPHDVLAVLGIYGSKPVAINDKHNQHRSNGEQIDRSPSWKRKEKVMNRGSEPSDRTTAQKRRINL